MKTKIYVLIMIIVLLCYSGCNSDDIPINKPEVNTLQDIQKAKKTVEESSNTIEKASGKIANEANKINIEANEAKGKVPENAKSKINPHLDSIKESSTAIIDDTTVINKASAELDGAKSLLGGAEIKVSVIEDALDKMTKERDKAVEAKKEAEADRDSALHKTLRWLIMGCIVGCGAFIVLFFYTGSKGGLTAAGGCGIVLIIAIAVNKFITYLAIGGGALLLLMAGILLYNIYIKNKAFSQVIETVEVTKSKLASSKKEELFGKDGNTGIMDSIQSPETMLLVKKEKAKMSLWNAVKNSEK